MKLIIFIILLSSYKVSSQTVLDYSLDMDSTKYVEKLIKLSGAGVPLYVVIPLKDKENKIFRAVLLNKIIARSFSIDFYNDTTFASVIRGTIKTPTNASEFNLAVHQYKVSEEIYSELKEYSPCEIYQKYFDEQGLPDNGKFLRYGEFYTVAAYLIDNYAVIVSDELSDFRVATKPCCSDCNR